MIFCKLLCDELVNKELTSCRGRNERKLMPACCTLVYYVCSIINNSCSVSCMFNASSNCLQETSSLIYIEKVQVCTLLNASVAVAAVDKPSAIMRMWQLASEAYWTVWKLIRWKLSVGLNNSL